MRRPSLLKNSSTGARNVTGAPYHPATNGAAERLVQTFKQALRKSSLPPKRALQEFLMQYRRTPTSCGFSPSELLNARQLRTRIDSLLPSPAHIAQGQAIQGDFKVSDDSRLGRCRQGYQAVQGRRSCVCAIPWTSPRQASPLGTCDRQEVTCQEVTRQGRRVV